jgi:hypothetical protein
MYPSNNTVGHATYNQPLKLEIRDPSLIKIIDHLKDVIDNHPKYYEIYKFPEYLLKYSKSSHQAGHFIEYYFCWLNVNLKTLSQHEPLANFMKKWDYLCRHLLGQANEQIMKPNGYHFKLKLQLNPTLRRTKRYPTINVPLNDDSDDADHQCRSLGKFFYTLKQSSQGESAYE